MEPLLKMRIQKLESLVFLLLKPLQNFKKMAIDSFYGLIEVENEEIAPSQDIDNVSKFGSINFLVPANKISNLEYYMLKIRYVVSCIAISHLRELRIA